MVYAVVAGHTQVRLAATLTPAVLNNGQGCSTVTGLAWSRDGTRLLMAVVPIAVLPQRRLLVDDYVPIKALLQTSALGSFDIPATQFEMVDMSPTGSATWNPQSGILAFSDAPTTEHSIGPERVMAFSPATHKATVWLTLQDANASYSASDLTWTLDGRQLLLIVGSNQCIDCNLWQLTDVYLYTPPAAPSS
jgi:hypothetical protein